MKDFIICKPLFVLRKRVVAPCGPVIPSRSVEGMYRIHLQSFESITNYNPADEGCTCRRNVGKELPTTEHNNTEDLVSQQSLRGYLNSLFSS
jgi:hypothetical protein